MGTRPTARPRGAPPPRREASARLPACSLTFEQAPATKSANAAAGALACRRWRFASPRRNGVGLCSSACELAAIDDDIFLADRAPFELERDDFKSGHIQLQRRSFGILVA